MLFTKTKILEQKFLTEPWDTQSLKAVLVSYKELIECCLSEFHFRSVTIDNLKFPHFFRNEADFEAKLSTTGFDHLPSTLIEKRTC